MFYVYEWYVKETKEIFYVGKGCGNRYKQTNKRNKLFKLYFENFNCESRIIKNFNSEDEAFEYEHQRIMELKTLNQAKCNLDYGGKGGCHFSWTEEMKEYQSQYNPMKAMEHRKRMSEKNPMKNPNVSKKVAKKKSKAVILNGEFFNSITEASFKTKHSQWTIIKWCRQGYDINGKPCRYANEQQKEIPLLKQLHPKAATPKPVIVNGVRYETIIDGAKAIGVWSETLIRAIKNNKKCKGYTCEYANQQPS